MSAGIETRHLRAMMARTAAASKCRADFERYAAQLGCTDFEETSEDGFRRYTNPFIQEKWNYWTASRDALAVPEPSAAASGNPIEASAGSQNIGSGLAPDAGDRASSEAAKD